VILVANSSPTSRESKPVVAGKCNNHPADRGLYPLGLAFLFNVRTFEEETSRLAAWKADGVENDVLNCVEAIAG
jgi:hypothetical protein